MVKHMHNVLIHDVAMATLSVHLGKESDSWEKRLLDVHKKGKFHPPDYQGPPLLRAPIGEDS